MAALDFPTPTVVGQTYAAPNGIVYRWDGTVWLALGNTTGPTPGGDFMAFRTTPPALTGTPTLLVADTVQTGNSGGAYNASTGRYTPPAGRFQIWASVNIFNGGGTGGSAVFELRKNGTQVKRSTPTTVAGSAVDAVLEALVDANGTDYFELFCSTAASQGVLGQLTFLAFPTSGVAGPPGPPGSVPTGDLFSTGVGAQIAPPSINTWFISKFPSVVTGNTGSWYNGTTGIYTPPAGRYRIGANYTFNSSGGGVLGQIKLRKNGIDVLPSGNAVAVSTSGAGGYGFVSVEAVVDANGTDTFDIQSQGNALYSNCWGSFYAYSISGTKGPQGDPGPAGSVPTGDFMSTFSGTLAATTTPTPVVLPNIITGNSGSWYNVATGRYTPPAGRYAINGSCSLLAGLSQSVGFLGIYKNGALITENKAICPVSNPESITVDAMLDANGTDYFDLRYSVPAGAQTLTAASFMAYPTAGTKGPTGDPGQLGFRLLSRQTLAVAAQDLKIQNIPNDINSLMFEVDCIPALNAQDFVMQFYDGAGALISAGYAWAVTGSTHTQAVGSAPGVISSVGIGATTSMFMTYGTTNRRVRNVEGIRVTGRIPNIRNTLTPRSFDFQSNYVSDDNTIWLFNTGSGTKSGAGFVLTGLRVLFGGGNIGAGGTLSVWGSP